VTFTRRLKPALYIREQVPDFVPFVTFVSFVVYLGN